MPTSWHLPRYRQPRFGTRLTKPQPGRGVTVQRAAPDRRVPGLVGVWHRACYDSLATDSSKASTAERTLLGGSHPCVVDAALAWCNGSHESSRLESIAGTARRRSFMMWDTTWNLVILAGAFMALGVLRLGLGARQAARWRPGGRSARSPEHLPRSGTDVITAPSTRAPFRHGGVSVSGLTRWGTNRVFLVVVKQDGRGGSARWSPSIAPVRYRWWARRLREHSWGTPFELAEVDEGMPRRHWEAFVTHEGGRPIQRVRAAVLLLAWIALAMGGMARGAAGEQGWTRTTGGRFNPSESTSVANDRAYAKARWC